MFKEQLLMDALRFYAGQHVLDRVMQMGRGALDLQYEHRHMTIMMVEVIILPRARDELSTEDFWAPYQARQRHIVDCIGRYGGVVDSFLGDEILAHWGLEGPGNHAVLALNCAAELLGGARSGDPADKYVKISIGLNTGNIPVGNFGTPGRGKFTVMGDEVNLASRLNQRCAGYCVPILISEAVLTHAGEVAQAARLVDSVQIKGREGLTDIFTLANIRGIDRATIPGARSTD